MSRNPFSAIYSKINRGTNKTKLANLPKAPRIIDVELTNHCNLYCTMCPTGNGTAKREKGFMSAEVFDRIVLYCGTNNVAIRLIRWGEPMLHPHLFRFIRLAKSFGIKVHMNTNGSLLDHDAIDDIINSGLDSIKFSFQGVTQDEYEEVRQGGNFIQLCGWVKQLYTKRGKGRHPYIQVGTTVSTKDEVAIKEFHKGMDKVSDLCTVGQTQDISNLSTSQPEAGKTPTPTCPEVYDKLSINWDGSVSACCRDYDNLMIVGNMRKYQTIQEIWEGENILLIQETLAQNDHIRFPLCRRCNL